MMVMMGYECSSNDSSNEVMTVGNVRWMTLVWKLITVLVVVVAVSGGGDGKID